MDRVTMIDILSQQNMRCNMNVIKILMGKLKDGEKLGTPVRSKEFIVKHISKVGAILLIGKGRKTTIPSKCLNGIPNFLKGKDWVEIGAIHEYASKPGTLEHYINSSKPEKTSIGNYVASILEHAEIVDIDRKPPSKVRLRSNNIFN